MEMWGSFAAGRGAAGQDAALGVQHSGGSRAACSGAGRSRQPAALGAAGQGAALLSASSECRCRPGKAPILREQRCPTAAQRTPQHPPHHPPLPTGRAGGFGCTRHAKLSLRPPTQLICTRRVVTPPPPLSTSCCPRVPPQAAPCWEQSCCSGQSATAALVVPGKQRHACSPQPSSHPTAPTLPAAAPGAAPIVALQFCRAVPHRRPSLSRCTAAIPLHRWMRRRECALC